MNNLLEMQKSFQARLLGEKSNFKNLVVSTKNPGVKERIDIYANGYFWRLSEAFGDNYSKLRQFMGEIAFAILAKKYVYSYPSDFRSIRYFGDKLPIFLQQDSRYIKRPFLAELAQFEWAINEAFDAANKTCLTTDNLKNIPAEKWGQMRFTFHPSVSYHQFAYNTTQLWESLLNDHIKKPSILPAPQTVLIWRYKLDTKYRVLTIMEAGMLDCAFAGADFATMCEKICNWVIPEKAAIEAATLLMGWLQNGLIV
ncbi:MAG TPA: putative DNA-binding domain-containing protein [Aquella sp.]|nr:putative DNA-binding domain-containing protein [Aquella sp.]